MKTAITIVLLAIATATFAQQKTTTSTPANKAISAQFEHSKGALLMPVVNGKITDHFGSHQKPLVKGTFVDQAGIDIATAANSKVHAAFEGTVINVLVSDNLNIIIVQHGTYFTVYSNMANISVKKGQHVAAGEDMGAEAVGDDGQPTLNFQLWHATDKGERVKLNPEEWLKAG